MPYESKVEKKKKGKEKLENQQMFESSFDTFQNISGVNS